MKILFVSNHFSLPNQPGAPRPWKVSHYLQSLGHDVTVVTNKRHYFDEHIEIGGNADCPEVVEGVKIIGVETSTGRRKSLFKRRQNYFSFSFNAYKQGRKIGKIDVIIVGTPPLLVPLTGLLLGKKTIPLPSLKFGIYTRKPPKSWEKSETEWCFLFGKNGKIFYGNDMIAWSP